MVSKSEVGNSEVGERLKPGEKLLLAGPAAVLSFAIALHGGKNAEEIGRSRILREYAAIHYTFSQLVGKENLIVLKNKIGVKKQLDSGEIVYEDIFLPETDIFNERELPFLSWRGSYWPRDAYGVFGDQLYVNGDCWKAEYLEIFGAKASCLGEQGKVLHAGDVVLVTPDIWKKNKEELRELQDRGLRVGWIPFVDPYEQRYGIIEDHIDGHASLIENKEGGLSLVVGDSYSRQGRGTLKRIKAAADYIEADLVEVDDRSLPPLAFNLVQFNDRSVVVTGAEMNDLRFTLAELVGGERVFTTPIPIEQIPTVAKGGIRCLTNTLSVNLQI